MMAGDSLNLDFLSKWESILEEVQLDDIPLDFMEKISVELNNGKKLEFPVQEYLTKGVSPEEVEFAIRKKIEDVEDDVKFVNYHVHVKKIANEANQATSDLLKKL